MFDCCFLFVFWRGSLELPRILGTCMPRAAILAWRREDHLRHRLRWRLTVSSLPDTLKWHAHQDLIITDYFSGLDGAQKKMTES